MSRREAVAQEEILNTAFLIAREEGIGSVSARKVAARAGCSTQPVFRAYQNMESMVADVYERAAGFFGDYYSLYPKTERQPFVNLGMAYISFARTEKHLFQMLFLEGGSQKSMYELLNGPEGNIVYEIEAAASMGCGDPEKLFTGMWVWIHGAACMALRGEYDLPDSETVRLLGQLGKAFAGEE